MTTEDIDDMIDEEIARLREENGETEDTDEEDCLGPEEVYRMARDTVFTSIQNAMKGIKT